MMLIADANFGPGTTTLEAPAIRWPSGAIRPTLCLALWGPLFCPSFQWRLEALEANDLPEADDHLESDMLWASLLDHMAVADGSP